MPQRGEAQLRMTMQGLAFCTRALLIACVLSGFASRAWGYRPFVSTDAAVSERQEMEIELGYVTCAS